MRSMRSGQGREQERDSVKRLICSFSGGRTSAYMTWRVLREWKDDYDDIVVLFANTGLEHEKTLEFVRNCDKYFGFNTVWMEAVTHRVKGVGNSHRIVTFETASRNGEPYEDYVAWYGIPTVKAPKCTDSLKLEPMRHYIRTVLGHTRRDYEQCVGIRVDEIDRMLDPDSRRGKGILYPMVTWGVDKTQVREWWSQQDFDLDLPEHLGNCVTCFKKSERKLKTIAKHHPEYFEPMARMEARHSHVRGEDGVQRRFFRGHQTTADIIASSKNPFTEWTESTEHQLGLFPIDEQDISNGCTESCEVDFV